MTMITIDPRVDRIQVPVNLRVRRLLAEQKEKCASIGCTEHFFMFGYGHSPFPVPDLLCNSLVNHSSSGGYTDPLGFSQLREAAAGFFNRHYHVNADAARIAVGHGTKGLIHSIFTLLNGSVIVPSPGWLGYIPLLRILNKPYYRIYCHKRNDYKIRPQVLRAMLKGLVKTQHLLILTNPVNPTGVLYTRKELEEIAEVCKENNTLIMADEVYALTSFDPKQFVSMGSIYPEGTFVLNGLSFDRSAPGYRIGVCLTPEYTDKQIMDEMGKILSTYYTYASTPIQEAAVVAFEQNDQIESYIDATRSIYRIMGEGLSSLCNDIEGVHVPKPEAGIYFMADLNDMSHYLKNSGIQTSNDLAPALIDHPYHISAATGEAMMAPYGDYYIRFATTDYDGGKAMKEFLADPPSTRMDEEAFFTIFGSRMIAGMEMFRIWTQDIKNK